MQDTADRFAGRIEGRVPFTPRDASWEFFFRNFFTMFLRWTQPITLIDGTASTEARLMRRKVHGRWQYRLLDERELRYILAVENGTHC